MLLVLGCEPFDLGRTTFRFLLVMRPYINCILRLWQHALTADFKLSAVVG